MSTWTHGRCPRCRRSIQIESGCAAECPYCGWTDRPPIEEPEPPKPPAPHPHARELVSRLQAGDRIVYHDDEPPFALHDATVSRTSGLSTFIDVVADDIADDEPSIHCDLITEWPTRLTLREK